MIDSEVIKQMKSRAQQVISTYGGRDTELYARYREMFFMEEDKSKPRNPNVDEQDWAITISPSARNQVIGMVRLLDTSEIHIAVKTHGEEVNHSNKIERALKQMLLVSGEYRRARVESDAALSAVLYGPIVLYSESLDDLLEVNKDKFTRKQLEQIRRRSPFLIRSINPEQSYPEWGEFGLISHTWKYTVKGSVLTERWDCKDAKPDFDYTVYDLYDKENRLVYAEGITEPLLAEPHGLDAIPVISRYAGGSSLFHEPARQVQSFLYAKAKSRLDKRENALLTSIATAINQRGLPGPLFGIDPESLADRDSVMVNYSGSLRYIVGKVTPLDDNVISPVVFKWRELLNEIGGESTIHSQTLGQVSNQGTFSGLAMLSSAGKLPLVDSQRAIEMSFRDVFLSILQRIKSEGIENDLIKPSEIPADVELEVSLEPNLPQDKLRNAQIAQSLGDLVSDEWKHTYLMQVADSSEMRRQIVKESIEKAMLQAMLQDQETMKTLVSSVMGMPKKQPPPPASAPAQPAEQMPAMPPMPDAGMEGQMPQTDPMLMQQERM